MHSYKLLITYCVLIFIWIIIFIILTKYLFLVIIAIINSLFFHFVIILDGNDIGVEGAKALAEGLKVNKSVTELILGKFLLLFALIITIIISE